MPQNSTISNLPEDTSVTIADYVAIVTPGLGQTRKAKLSSILSLATGAGAPNYVGKYPSLAALQTDIPTGVDGNYAIITASPNDEEYIWDSDHTAWVKTENVPASTFALLGGNATDNASLAGELSARDASITAEASIRLSADANIQSQVSALSVALIPHPTYTVPTASISSTQTTGGLEIGQTINIPLTVTYNQNDGGSQTGLIIKKNGSQISTTSPFSDAGIVISSSPITYQSNVAYNQGNVKNNLIGIADGTGRILAGNVNSNILSYAGSYGMYYGTVSSLPTTSTQVKALSKLLRGSGNTMSLNTGTTGKIFVVCLPPGISINTITDIGNLNLDVKPDYLANTSAITVTDAGGNGVAYTLYAKIQSVPYNPSTTHVITTT